MPVACCATPVAFVLHVALCLFNLLMPIASSMLLHASSCWRALSCSCRRCAGVSFLVTREGTLCKKSESGIFGIFLLKMSILRFHEFVAEIGIIAKIGLLGRSAKSHESGIFGNFLKMLPFSFRSCRPLISRSRSYTCNPLSLKS